MTRNRIAWIGIALAAVVGCRGDLSLDVGSEEQGEDRFASIRRRLPITIEPGPTGFTGTLTCSQEGCSPEQFAHAILNNHCANPTPGRTTGDTGTGDTNECAKRAVTAETHVCAAQTMLRVIDSPAATEVLIAQPDYKDDGVVRVPPQDAESNFELARLAAQQAELALRSVADAFDPALCTDDELAVAAGTGETLEGLTVAEELAHFYAEALDVARTAGERAVETGTAVSDVAYSRGTDSGDAADDALAPFASRTAAAHMLLGGEVGLPAIAGVAEEGFFTRNGLSAEAQRAIELIRATAIDPALLLDTSSSGPTIDDIVVGSGSVTKQSSIRYRIGLMQSRSSLSGNTITAGAAYYRLGVTREGFVEARAYLREELRAFDRSHAAVLGDETLPDGQTTGALGITLYGATRSPPRQLHSSYWAAVLRYDPTPQPELGTYLYYTPPPAWATSPDAYGSLPPGDTWGTESDAGTAVPQVSGRRTVVSIVDEGYRRVPDILERLCPDATCPSTAFEQARDAVARVLVDASPDPVLGDAGTPEARYGNASYIGRARACVYAGDLDPEDFDVRIEVSGVTGITSSNKLLIVRGRDGLACAVDGRLEDVPCTSAQLGALTAGGAWTGSGGVWTSIAFDVPLADRPAPDTMTLFVVRTRPGVTSVPGVLVPGDWEELTGFVLPKPSSPTTLGYRYCQGTVIAPLYEREAASIIQPSTFATGRPDVSCAGIRSDFRIPLENEITSDTAGAPGTENSWRHYLDLARSAASEADNLGEDLIRTGLEADLRAESAADEISRLCGVNINVSSIARSIEDGPPLVIDRVGACELPYVESGVQCVLDPVLYAAQPAIRDRDDDMSRLAGCMGVDRVPWATLGDTSLCIWDLNGAEAGGICEGSNRDMPCPYVAPSDAEGDADCDGPLPFGARGILVGPRPDETDPRIGIFQRPLVIEPDPPDPNDFPCAALARVRAGGLHLLLLTREERERLVSLLTYPQFVAIARNLTWEASVGDYSSVRYAGSYRFSTGSVTGATTLWPMGPAPAAAACPGTATSEPGSHYGPLFCLQNLDPNRFARSRMNDLLARAVLAARIFTGLPLEGSVFPYYARNVADQYEVTPDTFDWSYLSGSTPAAYSAFTGELTVDENAAGFPSGDGIWPHALDATQLGSTFAYILGSGGEFCESDVVPEQAEWSSCPYRSNFMACRIFDDGPDCDDGEEPLDSQNVPLVLRPADRGLTVRDAAGVAVPLWERDRLPSVVFRSSTYSPSELDGPLLGRLVEGDVRHLTHYFDTWEESGTECSDWRFYEGCVEGASHRRLLQEGNDAFIGRNGLTVNDFLNGLELGCWAARGSVSFEPTNCAEPSGQIETLSDAYRMRGYLECRANEISGFAASALIQDLPRRVVEALRRDGTGMYGGGAGEFDAQVSDLRAALLELGNHRLDMAADIRAFAARIRSLDSAVSTSDRQSELERMAFFGRAMDRMTSCVTAAAEAATIDPAGAAGKAVAAGAVCTNTAGQILLDVAMQRLRDANVDDAIIDEFARFTGDATEFGRRMSQRSLAVRAALERIDGAIARLRTTQTAARRALARALMLSDGGTDEHFAVNTVYRARYNTLLERYRRAHQRAVRAAYIARIALEQRLGMPLADIQDDVFSDEAPGEWVDTICTLPSIDYDRIRGSNPGSDGTRGEDPDALPVPGDYSGTYVGDYVRRLEQVFESYSFVHPFREGTDTAVISLRDDVLRSRAPCEVESPNLLFNGGRLDVLASSERRGWRAEGCDVAAGSGADRQCVSISALEGGSAESPTGVEAARFGRPTPYLIEFGAYPVTGASTRLEQVVRLRPGRYRLSAWMVEEDYPTTDPWIRVQDETSSLVSSQYFYEAAPNGWTRLWTFFDVASERDVRVYIPRTVPELPAFKMDAVHIAGVMLEDVTRSVTGDVTRTEIVEEADGTEVTVVYGQRAAPGAFFESGDTGTREVRACIDQRGYYFRREAWERGCVRVCTDGYDGNCPPEWAESRCYWQTSFPISSDTLSNLLLAGDAGFAAGNYNYRIESVGVNLVGTGLRDCEGRESSGCYGSGSASYSIMHLGPYLVRNARGALYDAPLFPGRLESARALAAERYITNPLSGADRTLFEPYTRYELQGRPLGGALVLRLWDDPTFRFDRVEDVQVVLGYRYWQHQR